MKNTFTLLEQIDNQNLWKMIKSWIRLWCEFFFFLCVFMLKQFNLIVVYLCSQILVLVFFFTINVTFLIMNDRIGIDRIFFCSSLISYLLLDNVYLFVHFSCCLCRSDNRNIFNWIVDLNRIFNFHQETKGKHSDFIGLCLFFQLISHRAMPTKISIGPWWVCRMSLSGRVKVLSFFFQ